MTITHELERADGSTKPAHVLAAANIRRELKRAFPGVMFRVRSSSFAAGNSVDVSWTDGPTTQQVKAITDKYQEGDFDGSDDSYTYRQADMFTKRHGGAKYVLEQRACSLAGIRRAWQLRGEDPADCAEIDGNWDRWHSRQGDAIWRVWTETDLR